MTLVGRISARLVLGAVVTIVVVGAAVWLWKQTRKAPPVSIIAPTTSPATAPATLPTTAPVVRLDGAGTYLQHVRTINPKIATTRPLDFPVSFGDAAHLVLASPVYVCPMRDLWITLPDAPQLEETIQSAAREQIHATRETVMYVDWDTDDDGTRQPHVVCRDERGRFHVVDALGRRDVGGAFTYQWSRAFSWNDAIVVPTDDGISVLTLSPTVTESHEVLGAGRESRQVLVAPRGLIAWNPSGRASWFVDCKWKPLDEKSGWPDRIIHLVPMLDGSVLEILAGENGEHSVILQWGVLETAAVDEKRVAELVNSLSDPEEDKRDAAYKELQRFGPGVWPIIEKGIDDQPPEGQIRLRQLLGNRATPTLGGMTLLKNELSLAARLFDGGMVVLADGGVSIPRGNAEPALLTPAWISMRPGRPIELLPPALVHELDINKTRLVALRNEWIVIDNIQGPRRFMENHFEPLLRKDELEFSEPFAIDARGRWYFRKPSDPSRTLVIDPTILDPVPRLKVWAMTKKGTVGWTESGWPVVKQGGAWALEEDKWRPLDEKKERMLTTMPPSTAPTTILATTIPATTQSTSQPSEPPLLTDADGNSYYDGRSTLRAHTRDGRDILFPLPPQTVGSSEVCLIKTKEALFLFNQPGRVIRFSENLSADPPFTIEAIFTHKIPNVPHPTRIWLDPAGRIDIAYDTNKLAILFPSGQIPRAIELMMTEEGE